MSPMPTPPPRALILSGGGRYADPWHPFAETSGCVAEVLAEAGLEVRVSDEVDTELAALSPAVDLLVLNVGNPGTAAEAASPAPSPRAGLLAHLERGRPVLALHASASSLPDVPEWETVLGGRWVPGLSMHPDFGTATVRVLPSDSPLVAGLSDFELLDERYSHLRLSPEILPLAVHDHDGMQHPLLWQHRYGTAEIVYDALGHDPRSFDSSEHRAILARAARWLTRARGSAAV